jgi:hypothetical protein
LDYGGKIAIPITTGSQNPSNVIQFNEKVYGGITVRKTILYLACLCVFGLLTAGGAKADTIGPTGCSSCFGSAYTLTYSTVNANTFDIFLTVDATQSTSGDFLKAVALKVTSGPDLSSVTWLAGPTGFPSYELGGTDSGGCKSNSHNGFFCDPYSGSGKGVPVGASGDIYNFEWQVVLASASDLLTGTGANAASVKAVYVDGNGRFKAQTSEDITLSPTPVVPEPPSLLLLGSGLLILAGAFKTKLLLA